MAATLYLGKLCSRGHEWADTGQSQRFKSTRSCTVCVNFHRNHARANNPAYKAKEKEWATKNKSKRTAQTRLRYQANSAPFLAAQKRFFTKRSLDPEFREMIKMKKRTAYARKATPEFRVKENQRNIEYRKTHKDVGRAALMRRRARLRNQADGEYSAQHLKTRRQEFNNQCAYCGASDPKHFDHFIPVSAGGADGLRNIIPACDFCNLSKNAKPPYTWFRSRPFFDSQRWDTILKVLHY